MSNETPGKRVSRPMPPKAELQARFQRHHTPGHPDDCWEWTGPSNEHGYGRLYHGSRSLYAHRVSWYLRHGTDPLEKVVCHTCDNPACVNPHHLFIGEQADNMRDMAAKGRASREPRVYGTDHPHAKLTPRRVREIDRLRILGLDWSDIAARVGVSTTTAYRAGIRKTWRHVPGGCRPEVRRRKLSLVDQRRILAALPTSSKGALAERYGVSRATILNVEKAAAS